MKKFVASRKGYVLLLTVLVVGTISSASAIATLLLGLSVERNAFSIQQSSQAFAGAWSCAERAIKSLQEDLDYGGNETLQIQYGYSDGAGGITYDLTTCKVYPIMGDWNNDRYICTEATFGDYTVRRMEIKLSRVLPSTAVDSWNEVETVSICDPFTGPPPADCGNGFLQGGEECDDGNTKNNDLCSSVCLDEFCGDGSVQTVLSEECDDGGLCVGGTNAGAVCYAQATCPGGTCTAQSGDGCDNTCESEICGDGDVDSGEECDDSNVVAGDGCNAVCQDEFCGDNVIDADGPDNIASNSDDEACDDGGECVGGANAGLACTRTSDCPGGTCTPQSGDGCDSDCAIESSSSPGPTDYIFNWLLDETTTGGSNSVIDNSGNSYHGTPEGNSGSNSKPQPSTDIPTITPVSVRSLDFDGTDDRVRGSNTSALHPSAMTVSFWTKNDVSPAQWDGILCKTNRTSWSKGWGFFYDSSSEVRFFIQHWNSNVAYAPIVPTQWNHILGTYDGTTIRIYVNGVEGTSDVYTGSIHRNSRLFAGRCGSNNSANWYNIDGKLDDVRIYDRVLTADEIAALAAGN